MAQDRDELPQKQSDELQVTCTKERSEMSDVNKEKDRMARELTLLTCGFWFDA